MDFAEWLRINLNDHHMSQAELSRISGVSEPHISRLLYGAKAGEEAAQAIAVAFKLPPEEGLRAAGIWKPKKSEKRVAEEIAQYKLSELGDKQLDEVIQYIEFIQDRDDRSKKKEFLERHTRAEEAPETAKSG